MMKEFYVKYKNKIAKNFTIADFWQLVFWLIQTGIFSFWALHHFSDTKRSSAFIFCTVLSICVIISIILYFTNKGEVVAINLSVIKERGFEKEIAQQRYYIIFIIFMAFFSGFNNLYSAQILLPLIVIFTILVRTQDALFRENKQLEHEKTEAELTALKAQFNPHFLFNSLNGIYGTAVEESPKTAESIFQLSEMMRYTLEKSSQDKVSVFDEIKFLENYVALQRLRLPEQENIDIKLHIAYDEHPYEIAPLLLTPIIENAFKYGISIDNECYIYIELVVKDGWLHFECKNKRLSKRFLEQGTGTGLEHLEKRLKLTYTNHNFEVVKLPENFIVKLSFKI